MSTDEKIVPVAKWHKILGTILGVTLFTGIMLYIYNMVVMTAATWGAGFLARGEYENAYIFGSMALFGQAYQLLIMGGGIFFALVVSWLSAESCGLSKEDKPNTGKVAWDFFLALLFPIAGVIALLPLYGIIGFIAGFSRASSVVALMESPNIFDIAYVHFNTLGAFLMMCYVVYLIAMIPANAISIFIVSLVTLPYLKRRYFALNPRRAVDKETPVYEQSSQTKSSEHSAIALEGQSETAESRIIEESAAFQCPHCGETGVYDSAVLKTFGGFRCKKCGGRFTPESSTL